MAVNKKVQLSESELNARYTAAAYRFSTASSWQEYLELAEEFRALDTYKDSVQKYSQCVKAASAPAYRHITDDIRTKGTEATAAEFREAARVMQIIQDYQDAREVMRVYTVKANALTYEEAMTLLSNSEATTEELGQGVELLKSIKGFKNTRELIERFEKYYFDRMYNEALYLMENGRVFSELDEAAEKFERIAVYSDAAAQAALCRRKANKLRPKERKKKEKPEKPVSTGGNEVERVKKGGAQEAAPSTEEERVKPRRRRMVDDETHNSLVEVWHNIDKRRMVEFIFWVLLLLGDLYASIVLPNIQTDFFSKYANTIRIVTLLLAIFFIAMCCRAFLRMLTASMRKKLGQAAVKFAKKMVSPLVKVVNKLLLSIGIDLSRRNRLGGRDERSFVFEETEKVKKAKKRLKNELKWVDQTDNAARVRFIFIDYMIRRIKKGYFMKRSMTPKEIGCEIAMEEDEKNLFAVYEKARYAGKRGVEEITDAMVGELQLVNRKRSQ